MADTTDPAPPPAAPAGPGRPAPEALTVRRLTEADWDSYRELRLEMLADAPDFFWATLDEVADYTEQTWRERVSGPQTHLQALAHGEPAGALSIDWIGYTQDMLLDEDTVNIVSVYVRPAHRGRGVVEALLAAADEVMREAGRTRQLLETPEDNERGRRAYAKLGFVETGCRSADPRRPHLEEVEYGRIVPPR